MGCWQCWGNCTNYVHNMSHVSQAHTFSFSITAFCWFCSWAYSTLPFSSSSSSCSDDDSLAPSSLSSHACSYNMSCTCTHVHLLEVINTSLSYHVKLVPGTIVIWIYSCRLPCISTFPWLHLILFIFCALISNWGKCLHGEKQVILYPHSSYYISGTLIFLPLYDSRTA